MHRRILHWQRRNGRAVLQEWRYSREEYLIMREEEVLGIIKK